MITKVISAIKEATSLNVYAFAAPRVEKCVVYQYTPLGDNGASSQARVEFRVIAFSLAECEETAKQIKNALMSQGDGSKIEGISSITSSGGGALVEQGSGTTQMFINFQITMKSEVR